MDELQQWVIYRIMSGLQYPASTPCWTKSRSNFYALIDGFVVFRIWNI